jgi:[ribosomal protein S5]-alanine N-acetyltransferase
MSTNAVPRSGPVRAPETLATERLLLRRPTAADASAILSYAGDPEVTRLLEWPRHRSVEDTLAFVSWADAAWSATPAGPYLITDRDGRILGSTGLNVETPYRATIGYVLARDAWGQGFATEVAGAMVRLAASLGLVRLAAFCHPDNRASARVLEKVGFIREGVLRRHTVFPNLDPDRPHDVESWARIAPSK